MTDFRTSDPLSFGDALFFHLERHGSPLHVAALCLFDGEILLEHLRAHVESRLPLIPRYLQRVMPAPFGLGMPTWEFDPNFDIHHHVRELRLKRGTLTELQKVVSEILSHRLDRQRPLWEFTIINGMRNKRSALLMRVHHCLADGISGVNMLNIMLDATPNAPPKTVNPIEIPVSSPRDSATLFMDSLITSWFSMLERVLTVESQVLRMAQEMVSTAAATVNGNSNGNSTGTQAPLPPEVASLLPEFGAPPDRLPFNIVCQGPQSFEFTEIPFQDIRAIKHACNATVNDVILTLIAMTVRRYAQVKGATTSRRIVRIVVPVNIRNADQANGYGNQITFVPVTVPFGIKSPKDLLQAVHTRADAVKKLRLAELVSLGGTLLGTIPTAFQMFAAPIVSQLPLPLLNFICTNVPGPQNPLYLLGREMLTCYPYVPIGGEMGMNCAILSYNGKVFVGFTCDTKATTDSQLLPQFLQESFAELKEAFGVKSRSVRGTRSRKAAPKAQEPPAQNDVTPPPAETKLPEPAAIEPERAMAQIASD